MYFILYKSLKHESYYPGNLKLFNLGPCVLLKLMRTISNEIFFSLIYSLMYNLFNNSKHTIWKLRTKLTYINLMVSKIKKERIRNQAMQNSVFNQNFLIQQLFSHHLLSSNFLQLALPWSTVTKTFAFTASSVSITTRFWETFLRAWFGKVLPLALKEYTTCLIRLGKSKTLVKSEVHVVPLPSKDIFAVVAFKFIPLTTFLATKTWSIWLKGLFDWSNLTISTPLFKPENMLSTILRPLTILLTDFNTILASSRKRLLEVFGDNIGVIC